jgi:hypothetical protein
VTGRVTSIGLISDTHGLLRDAALEALRGSERNWRLSSR